MSKYIIDLRPDCKVVQQICASNENVSLGARSVGLLDALTDDYVKENFKDLLDAEYQRGLNDSWECGKKLALTAKYGGYGELLSDVFGRDDAFDFYDYTPNEAIEKLKAFEQKQDEIEVGDEVRLCRHKVPYIVTSCDGDDDAYILMTVNGGFIKAEKYNVRKTNRHFDIKGILEAMKHD